MVDIEKELLARANEFQVGAGGGDVDFEYAWLETTAPHNIMITPELLRRAAELIGKLRQQTIHAIVEQWDNNKVIRRHVFTSLEKARQYDILLVAAGFNTRFNIIPDTWVFHPDV